MDDFTNRSTIAADATTTDTTTMTVKVPGIIGRIVRRLENHPIATSVGLSLSAIAAAAGSVNYRRHGSVLPYGMSASDATDVARAVSAAFAPR